MLIKKLKVENLRNLQEVDITPNPKLNVLFGGNGAGKTSVLESIVVLLVVATLSKMVTLKYDC